MPTLVPAVRRPPVNRAPWVAGGLGAALCVVALALGVLGFVMVLNRSTPSLRAFGSSTLEAVAIVSLGRR